MLHHCIFVGFKRNQKKEQKKENQTKAQKAREKGNREISWRRNIYILTESTSLSQKWVMVVKKSNLFHFKWCVSKYKVFYSCIALDFCRIMYYCSYNHIYSSCIAYMTYMYKCLYGNGALPNLYWEASENDFVSMRYSDSIWFIFKYTWCSR